jgi:Na+/melibiose symporter-like transporter
MLLSACVNFFAAYFGHRELARWPPVAATAAGLVASFVWPAVSRARGKRFAWMTGMAIAALVLVAIYALEPKSVAAYVVGFFLVGCGVQAGLIIQFAAVADSLDYGEWKTGLRTEAVGFALMTCATKVSLAIGSGLVGWLFAASGFAPNQVPTGSTLEGMRMTFLAAPAAGFLLAAFVLRFYPITAADQRRYVQQIAHRRRLAAASESAVVPAQSPTEVIS